MATIKTDLTTAEVWQLAQLRRTADLASSLQSSSFPTPARSGRRRMLLPTVFASLVLAVAVWSVAGQPRHADKTVALLAHTK
jgi:hypothetical protein